MNRPSLLALLVVLLAVPTGRSLAAQPSPVLSALEGLYPELDVFYRDLHQTPELAFQEEKTAAKLAERLRKLGFDVTTGVGGTGVVALLRNGPGPTVMLRTDLDGLPMEEKTGLAYASKATVKNGEGQTVPVMHACGHDVHMTVWLGTATLLARKKDQWRGTLMMVGQPAEEVGAGARKMLADGLFKRFPKPDFAVALHNTTSAPAGRVEYVSGYALAYVDSVDVTLYGKGGHGAYPHTTVDPVVMAARTVLSLQTLVSREKHPLEPAVVTVGSIQGGTKHNIIPDEVRLQLTVRSYKPEVRKALLAGIERIVKAEALVSGATRPPDVAVTEGTPATYNDPALTRRLTASLIRTLGEKNVGEAQPVMGGEDFSEYGRAGVPAVMLWLGAVEPGRFQQSRSGGEPLPSLHSSGFVPDRERTLRTGVTALTSSALELLNKP
ncbi:M20 (carboxypeptidase Ss1) subfamily protein [Myxococcus stipitatus DSM 14675]|uniref:M20 (Carboxypeptidase Ss1) subfamily protein n=1 Tax=Myxococcus stipitatus (strain DSM 14675 / JCM 12634 / Mx s8) TaxID=1278073 RepID=L7UG36_MYXSD|nr:amidohydrolase [Myxococcus stipitatus]AGC46860.1 M20 (carboxypeptidase Ss1) subfamily protein [Myxococcus stipitatus DSM 14675]